METVATSDAATIASAGEILARAFFEDPGFVWTFPDEAMRRQALAFLMPRIFGMHTGMGHCWVSRDAGTGAVIAASVWAPPGTQFGFGTYLRYGLVRMPLKFGLAAVRRMLQADEAMKSVKKRHAPAAGHYFLDTLGVDPDRQGEGLGSRLLRANLVDTVDPTGLPATLFTTKPGNVPFYERSGFDVVSKSTVGGEGGFSLWYMQRPVPVAP